MSYDVLPPDPPEHGRTAYEVEHDQDPPDDAGRFARLPGFDLPPADWKKLAEEYRRERDYWRDQYDGAADDLAELQRRMRTGER